MSAGPELSTSGAPIGVLGGAAIAVLAYVFFSWGMASGLVPVPSRAAQRWGSLVLLVIIGMLLVAQVLLVVWAHLDS